MDYGAIDLHKKESQIRIVTEAGEIIDRRVTTTRERFGNVFSGRPQMRILLEASTESEWVAQHLEQMGHEVIVADPNYAPMYGHRTRRIKTDRRDVAALTEACQRGTYRRAHRRSAHQHAIQCQLNVRKELTHARTRAISVARAITRAAGFRIRSGRTETFLTRLAAADLPDNMKTTLAPLHSLIEVLDDELAAADDRFAAIAAGDPALLRLTTLPGIGPITASAFVAALDDAARFRGARQVTSYLGLVPVEYSSGERQRRGRILRSAHPHLQSLLVQAAWRMWKSSRADTAACGRGHRILRVAVEPRSRPSRWPAGSRAFFSPCGGIKPSINRPESGVGCSDPPPRRPRR